MDQKFNGKKGKCPNCQIEMVQHPESIDHNVIIDTCPKCGGIWLDSTEIDRLEKDESKLRSPTSLIGRALQAVLGMRKKTDSDSRDNVEYDE